MPLNSISKDSEASNAPASLKTNRTLQQLDADNAILKLKKKKNSGFGWGEGDNRNKPDTGCQLEISTVFN